MTAVLLPLTPGLVVQPLLLPQLSLPPSPAIWLPGLLLAIAGLGLVLLSSLVLLYAALLWIVFHVLVVRIEEPAMRNRFPEEYAAHVGTTPHWLPQLRR